MDFLFQSNIIHSTNFPIRLIVLGDFNLRIIDLKFPDAIDCDEALNLRYNQFLRGFGDTIYFRIKKKSAEAYYSLSTILSNTCAVYTNTVIALISIAAILLLIFAIAVTAVFYHYLVKYQKKRQLNIINPEGKTYRETQIIMQIENAGLLKTDL